jgi:hypothetical protein
MLLYYTPILFATISVHAFLIRRNLVGLCWLIQNQVSLIHHANDADPNRHAGGKIVHTIDRVMACINWCYALRRAFALSSGILSSWVVWFSLPYTFVVYYMFLVHTNSRDYMPPYNHVVVRAHQSLHAVSTIGLHALLIADEK